MSRTQSKGTTLTPFDKFARVSDALTDRLADVAHRCAPGRFWDAPDNERIRVGDFDVSESVTCEARAGATPITPFESSVRTVWRAAAYDTLYELRDGADGPPGAYRAAHAHGDPERWPWSWIRTNGRDTPSASPAERVLVGQKAINLTSAAARGFGTWPPEGLQQFGWRPDWFYPDRALRLAGRIDAVLRLDGETTLAFFIRGGWNRRLLRQVAYNSVMATLGREDPDAALVMFPDLGAHRTMRLAVDGALLDDGVEAAAQAAEILAVRAGLMVRELARTPGPHCRYCEIAAGCDPGSDWLGGPGARRFGFPIHPTIA
jgi:hypothetical protein